MLSVEVLPGLLVMTGEIATAMPCAEPASIEEAAANGKASPVRVANMISSNAPIIQIRENDFLTLLVSICMTFVP